MKTREEIESKYKINTGDLFENDASFDEEIENLDNVIESIAQYKNHILESSDNLFKVLRQDVEIEKRIERLYVYAHLNNDFDLADKNANELMGKVMKLNQRYSVLSNYIVPEITSKNWDIIESYINENPKLLEFKRTLKELFRLKDHILSDSEEQILSKLSDSFSLPDEIHTKLLDSDLEFGYIKDENNKKVQITTANYPTYMESKNRRVRKDTFEVFYRGYESVLNTTATSLIGEVKNNNALASIRKYNSALEASLKANDVDIKVYQTLLKSISNNIDIISRQWDIRKKVLKIDDLHIYDTMVSLVKGYDKKYTFEEAKQLTIKALSILGKDYIDKIKEAFENGWIDVYPTKNKRSGGYCTACYLAHPYVFLNYDGRYDEVSTLVHELGHAMHYYYAINNNTYQDYGYSIFVAEVASQVNELLLSYYMLNNTEDKDEKLFILDEMISRFKASVVRQTMFSQFEYKIHELEQNKTVLTKELFNEIYYDLNKKYYNNNIVIDEQIKYEWSRIPHFYYNFYVYQYSTGYIAALKIASDIYNKKPNALQNYLQFLKLGCTKNPVDSLKIAGVDLTDENTFNDAFKEFSKTMDEFEKLIKE